MRNFDFKRYTPRSKKLLRASLKLELKLEDNISDDEKCEIRTKLEIKKQSLEQVISYKTQGSIIRCSTPWYNEGEKIQSISLVWKKGIIIVKQ